MKCTPPDLRKNSKQRNSQATSGERNVDNGFQLSSTAKEDVSDSIRQNWMETSDVT